VTSIPFIEVTQEYLIIDIYISLSIYMVGLPFMGENSPHDKIGSGNCYIYCSNLTIINTGLAVSSRLLASSC